MLVPVIDKQEDHNRLSSCYGPRILHKIFINTLPGRIYGEKHRTTPYPYTTKILFVIIATVIETSVVLPTLFRLDDSLWCSPDDGFLRTGP